MTGWRKQLLWLSAVLALAVALVGFSAWRGFLDLLQQEPVFTRSVPLNSTVHLTDATVTVAAADLGSSETFDVSRMDDENQQVLRVSSLYFPTEIQEDIEYCTALLSATVDDVAARYQPRFSLTEGTCDGTELSPQQSEFYFIIPSGDVAEATFYLQLGGESYRWLAVPVG